MYKLISLHYIYVNKCLMCCEHKIDMKRLEAINTERCNYLMNLLKGLIAFETT